LVAVAACFDNSEIRDPVLLNRSAMVLGGFRGERGSSAMQ